MKRQRFRPDESALAKAVRACPLFANNVYIDIEYTCVCQKHFLAINTFLNSHRCLSINICVRIEVSYVESHNRRNVHTESYRQIHSRGTRFNHDDYGTLPR